MREKIIKSGAVGAIILFIWGMFSWAVLPWHTMQFKQFSNEAAVQNAILSNAPTSGLYTIPSCCNRDKKMDKGPFIFMSVMKEEKSYNMTGSIIAALIMKFVAACLVTWLLLQTKLDFRKSVVFIVVIGFLVGLLGELPKVIWHQFPGMFAFTMIVDSIIGWFLAALAIAKLARK